MVPSPFFSSPVIPSINAEPAYWTSVRRTLHYNDIHDMAIFQRCSVVGSSVQLPADLRNHAGPRPLSEVDVVVHGPKPFDGSDLPLASCRLRPNNMNAGQS